MSIEKNELHRVKIESYSSEGYGVCRIGGFVVFVKEAAAGDECVVRIVKVLKNMAYAIIESIIVPSPARTERACSVFPKCGGCDFWHISYEEELRLKKERVLDALSRIGGFDITPEEVFPSPKLISYRNKAQYPVTARDGKAAAGFYRKHSHEVVPVSSCPIQSDSANTLMSSVVGWMDSNSVPAELIKNIYVRTSSDGGAFLCIVSQRESLPAEDKLVKAAKSACRELKGVILNINKSSGNAILGDKERVLWGAGHIEDTLCGLNFRISPLSFFQINHDQAENLFSRALLYAGLTGVETALDLYCGTGTVTLMLARKCKTAIGVEIVPEAIKDAKMNAAENNILNVRFICKDAGEAAEMLINENLRPDLITVDPPRRGLDEKSVSAILRLAPKRIVYISCDPGTLARDCRLLSAGGYSPDRLSIIDMFPRTAHVETVVLMTKCG
ncbi:MAG: 23S rRNA (uracil(1939)-C(5))-methyltransferase RlmD [Bacillota bacterium]|nr:23S rRNA (uracil(1939)-C(5))-methyltransferase RlmD [Bacillota bacterium]